MDGISAGNLLFGLNRAKSTENKLNRFISEKDTNGDNALTIKELGVGKDIFDRIDKNSDGQVDKFEIIIAAHNRAKGMSDAGKPGVPINIFDRIDKDGDGKVDKVGLDIADHNRSDAVDERINQLLSKKDTNGDGLLNIGELGVPEVAFKRIDKNGDGQVGIGELNIDARNDIATKNHIRAVNERISHLLSKKDTNGNGVLDIGELGMSKDVFDKIDKNGNSQVGRLELNVAAHARAAINNLLSDILPNKEPSKLDATV